MTSKKILLTTIASTVLFSTSAFAGKTAMIKGDHNTLIYQITEIQGKAFIDLPNGKRHIARPGMKLPHGARVTVLENSILKGIDLHHNCQVEYIECIDRPIHRNELCATPAIAGGEAAPVITAPVTPGYTPHVVTTPMIAPKYVAIQSGTNFSPYLIGGGLLAATLLGIDRGEVNVTTNISNSGGNTNNENNGGNNNSENNGGNNSNTGGNNANPGGNNTNTGGSNANLGGNNTNTGGSNANLGGNNTNSGGNNANPGGNNNGGMVINPAPISD